MALNHFRARHFGAISFAALAGGLAVAAQVVAPRRGMGFVAPPRRADLDDVPLVENDDDEVLLLLTYALSAYLH